MNFFDQLIFLLNSGVAALLLLSYLFPFLPPKTFSFLAVLSLSVPFLILINLVFCVFWLIKIKRQFILSALILALGYNHLSSLYKFSSENLKATDQSISLMSYNVRLLNLYNWIKDDSIPEKINRFINKNSPDILVVQEYNSNAAKKMPYPYEFSTGTETKSELVIFSKFPFLDTGIIKFPKSANSAIYADVLIKSDTLRIYNIHLQSSGIDPDVQQLDSKTSDRLFKRISTTFKAQQDQAELLVKHISNSPHKVILSGDFNTTAYSFVYRLLQADFQDAFEVAGTGFGRTFSFDYFPLRIDFILMDNRLAIKKFKNYDVLFSDHFPISAFFEIN